MRIVAARGQTAGLTTASRTLRALHGRCAAGERESYGTVVIVGKSGGIVSYTGGVVLLPPQ
jgi:hypothetical protein